jgi:hypothetical protein
MFITDIMISGATGAPAPVLSGLKFLKDKVKGRKLRKRIDDALAEGD